MHRLRLGGYSVIWGLPGIYRFSSFLYLVWEDIGSHLLYGTFLVRHEILGSNTTLVLSSMRYPRSQCVATDDVDLFIQ